MRPVTAQLERHFLLVLESTIPVGMTLDEWRRGRSSRRAAKRRGAARVRAAARRVMQPRPVACDHLHESTTRYDRSAKRLTFLLACPTCGIEKVVETIDYEPRFAPHPARGDATCGPRSPRHGVAGH